jgi:superfamily II DNA or RNA helicase
MITVHIDNHLRVRKADLPPGHEAMIKARLTVPNGEKAKARKLGLWGAEDLPDVFALYEDSGPELILPRGYAAELYAGLTASGHEVSWVDHTSAPRLAPVELIAQGPTLHPDQEAACQAFLRNRQGVLQAPAGAGKTVLVLEAWRRAGLRGLILVEKAGLAKQWRERAREHLGVEVGMIGEGEWDERALTVAMLQTLRRRAIHHMWWRRFGFTVADECHHLQAESYQDVIRHVHSRYLVGVTATPLEGDWRQPYLTHVLGPIFHITTDAQLRASGRRVTPVVRRVRTGWRWVPANAQQEQLVDTRAIYRHVIKALERDEDRVGLIARAIAAQPPKCAQLVVSKRLGYLDLIHDALRGTGYYGDVHYMRGSESGDERAIVSQMADKGSCVILATVADEGVDIPRLDRLHLVWPTRKELTLIQQIGRALRAHPDKRDAVIYDYVDSQGMLVSQAQARLKVYRRFGYAVEERTMQGNLT